MVVTNFFHFFQAGDWLNLLTSFVPNLGAIGSNAIFCESFSGLGLGRPILPGADVFPLWKYRVFSLTWPAYMQIYCNKRGVWIRKEFNSQRTGLGHQHGRRFIVLGPQYGRRDVM